MAASTLSALSKRHWDSCSRSLDSIKSIYDSSTLAERICIPQRPQPPTLPPPKHGRPVIPQPSSTAKSRGYGELWNRAKMML